MTTRKTSMFMIGLFVTVGIVIGVVFVIWVGASRYFEKGEVFSTYFDESVQGLQVDSSVKYRGVDVGRVMKIRLAPDHRLVEVVLKIKEKGIIDEGVVAELKSAGITGIVFIELDRKQKGEQILGPAMPFATDFPVIASRPSHIKQIMAGLTEIYTKIMAVDLDGAVEQFKRTTKTIDAFFSGPAMVRTMGALEATMASLEATTKKLDRIMSEGKVDAILAEAQQSLAETRQTVAFLKEELAAMKLADRSYRLGRLADDLDRRSQKISARLEALLTGVRRNSEQLERLLERLNRNPAVLLFGTEDGEGAGP
ncbi:MAG: MlaD family protein [Syntrophales bacterium]|nr:MlaD family protein [Syntrophales bacterium]